MDRWWPVVYGSPLMISSWIRFESAFSWHGFPKHCSVGQGLLPMMPHISQKTFQKLLLISLTFGLHGCGWGWGSHSYKVFRIVQKWERPLFDHSLSGYCTLAIIVLTNFFPSQASLPARLRDSERPGARLE